MIYFISYLVSVFIVILGFGLLLRRFLLIQGYVNSISLGETGLLGFYFLLILSFLLHFFIPLNYFVTILIFVLGILLFIFYFKNIIKFNFPIKFILLIFLIFLPALFSIKGHPDLEWYHLPYLNYLKDFKIIFGIANVNDFLGFQSWNDIAGILRLPIIGAKGINIIPVVFFIFFLLILVELLIKNNQAKLKIFILLIIIFLISNYNRINEYGGHVPPQLLCFLISVYFYQLFFEPNNKDYVYKILIFTSFVLLLRINYIFVFPVLAFIFIKYNKLVFKFILNKNIFFLILFIPSIYFIKNIIHTGCLIYPVDYTCFTQKYLDWSVGKNYAKVRYDGTKASVRGWNQHVLIDGNIDDRVDYLIPLEKNQILSHIDYNSQKNFFWLKYWIMSGDVIKILNNIIIVFFCFIVLIIFGKKHKQRTIQFNYFIPFIVFFLQLFLWFMLTPQTIYGGDSAIVIFCAFISSFFLQNLNLDTKRTKIVVFTLFLLSISYFEIKNINRTYNEFFKDNAQSNIFPWVKIKQNQLNKDYYEIQIDDYTLNIQKKIIGRKEGLPDPCGSTPMICLPQDRTQCIKGVGKKLSYLIIKGNEKLCIEHLHNRYFY